MANKPRGTSTRYQLAQRVINGELKTCREWAVELYGHLSSEEKQLASVQRDLYRTRQMGIMLFPIPPAQGGPGVVQCVNEKLTEFTYAYNRHANRLENMLKSNVHVAEVFVKNHEGVRELVTKRVQSLIQQSAQADQHLLTVKYEPSTSLLEAFKN